MPYIDMENQDIIDEQDKEYLRKEKERHLLDVLQNENSITTLRVKRKTRDLLSKICSKEMSFNEAIVMLLDYYHKREKDEK